MLKSFRWMEEFKHQGGKENNGTGGDSLYNRNKGKKLAPSDQLDFNSFKWELNDKENLLMRICPAKRTRLLY